MAITEKITILKLYKIVVFTKELMFLFSLFFIKTKSITVLIPLEKERRTQEINLHAK